MRSGRPGGGRHVAGRASRARAEQLWRETVARTPEPESATNGSNAPHLPLSPPRAEGERRWLHRIPLSSPRGGEGRGEEGEGQVKRSAASD